MQPNARFCPTLSEPLFFFPSLRVRAWLWRRQRDKLSANINSTVHRRAVVNNNTEKLRWPALHQPWRRDSGRQSGCHLRLFEAAADTLCPPHFHLLLRPPLHSRPLEVWFASLRTSVTGMAVARLHITGDGADTITQLQTRPCQLQDHAHYTRTHMFPCTEASAAARNRSRAVVWVLSEMSEGSDHYQRLQ